MAIPTSPALPDMEHLDEVAEVVTRNNRKMVVDNYTFMVFVDFKKVKELDGGNLIVEV